MQNRVKWMGALCLALALAGCSLGKMEPAPVLYDLGIEEGPAPAGVGKRNLTRSGGAGAPLGGNRSPRQELADDVSLVRLLRKRGPDAVRRRERSAGRRAFRIATEGRGPHRPTGGSPAARGAFSRRLRASRRSAPLAFAGRSAMRMARTRAKRAAGTRAVAG